MDSVPVAIKYVGISLYNSRSVKRLTVLRAVFRSLGRENEFRYISVDRFRKITS